MGRPNIYNPPGFTRHHTEHYPHSCGTSFGSTPVSNRSVASGLSRFSAVRPLRMLPSGPLSCLRAFSLQRGTSFGMAPISVLSVASEVSRFSVVLTLASLPFGPCLNSQPCPLQRGMDFRITPILGLTVASQLARFSAVRSLGLLPFGHFGSLRAFPLLYDTKPGLSPNWASFKAADPIGANG
jgi:hypothetical protein